MAQRHRTDRFRIRATPEHVLEMAADPRRFPEFNPIVTVPADSGRVENVGNVYTQTVVLGPMRLATRWETTAVTPANLADRPRPPLPWVTVEVGDVSVVGRWVSVTRYEAARSGTLVTHELTYDVPDGLRGSVVDALFMRPMLGVAIPLLGRWLKRWIEAEASAIRPGATDESQPETPSIAT